MREGQEPSGLVLIVEDQVSGAKLRQREAFVLGRDMASLPARP